jgi:hypothetical protein
LIGAGGLVITTPTPDALCPPLGATRDAVDARLGSLELEGTWRATYNVVHRVDGDYVELKLQDGADQVRLERALPVRGESCSTLAQVIALVLERYFQRPGGELAATEPEAPAREAAPPPPEPVETPAAVPPPSPAPEPSGRAFLGFGGYVGNVWAGPSVELGWRGTHARTLPAWFRLSLGLDVLSHEEDVPSASGTGSAEANRYVGRLGIGWPFAAGPFAFAAGPEFIGILEHAEPRNIKDPEQATRLLPAAGFVARAALPLTPRARGASLALFVEGGAAWIPHGLIREFQITESDGTEVEILDPPNGCAGLVAGIDLRL